MSQLQHIPNSRPPAPVVMEAMRTGMEMPPGTTSDQVAGCMSIIAAIASIRHGGQPPIASGGGGGGGNIGGVGYASTSLTDYPKTGEVTTGDIWVDPTGANGSGTEGSPYNNLSDALTAVSDGQRIIVKAGTLTLSSQISRSTSWATGIEVFNYGTDRPIIDASSLTSTARALYFTGGSNEHWKGFEFKGGPDRGIDIASTNTTIEDVWVHNFQRDGIYIANFGNGAGNNLVQDFRVWRLGDGISGGSNVPDGIALTGNTSSPTVGNTLVRGFVANGADDGVDLYRARNTRVIDVVVFKSGYYWDGSRVGSNDDPVALSDGNGFKMGGSDSDSGDNYTIGCLAIGCATSGFTHNEAANSTTQSDPNIVFAFSTAVNNGSAAFNTGGDGTYHLNVRRDCIAWGNGSVGYLGANAVSLRYLTTDPSFVNAVGHDYSLDTGSAGIDGGIQEGISNSVATQPTTGTAANQGASTLALEIALDWCNRDLTV